MKISKSDIKVVLSQVKPSDPKPVMNVSKHSAHLGGVED